MHVMGLVGKGLRFGKQRARPNCDTKCMLPQFGCRFSFWVLPRRVVCELRHHAVIEVERWLRWNGQGKP